VESRSLKNKISDAEEGVENGENGKECQGSGETKRIRSLNFRSPRVEQARQRMNEKIRKRAIRREEARRNRNVGGVE